MRKPFRPISASLCLHTSEFVHDWQSFRRGFFQVAGYFFWLKVFFKFELDKLDNVACLQRFTVLYMKTKTRLWKTNTQAKDTPVTLKQLCKRHLYSVLGVFENTDFVFFAHSKKNYKYCWFILGFHFILLDLAPKSKLNSFSFVCITVIDLFHVL